MSLQAADSQMRDLLEQESLNAAQGAGIQRANSRDSSSYGNPTVTTTVPIQGNMQDGNINSQSNAFINRSRSINYLQPQPIITGSSVNNPRGYSVTATSAAPTTASRLRTGHYNNLLGRYPTLDPNVHPIAGTTRPVEVGSKSRIVTSPVKMTQ